MGGSEVWGSPTPVGVRQKFEQELSQFLERPIHIPTDPDEHVLARLKEHPSFELVYIPSIREDQLPRKIARPNRRRYIDDAYAEKLSLSPGWVSVEKIDLHACRAAAESKLDRNSRLNGLRLKCDPVLDLAFSRFGHTYGQQVHGHTRIIGDLLPRIAAHLNADDPHLGQKNQLPKIHSPQLMLPSLEERHFIAAWFAFQYAKHGRQDLPDLNDGIRRWEWVRNQYRDECRVIVSGREEGGMMAVSSGAEDTPDMNTGFRVLIRH